MKFTTILFVVFLTLKLAEIGAVADWSWWWVTSPLWITTALYVLLFFAFVVVAVAKHVLRKRRFEKSDLNSNIKIHTKSRFQIKLDEKMRERKIKTPNE